MSDEVTIRVKIPPDGHATAGHGYLLAIDPGVRGCGVALFRGGRLQVAGFAGHTNKESLDDKHTRASVINTVADVVRECLGGVPISMLAIEMPRVHDKKHQVGGKSKVDPNDIVKLATVVGALIHEFSEATTTVYLPHEWKGQLPKDICHDRAMGRLDDEERANLARVVEGKISKKHLLDVLDAVALGLHHVRRL